jgi:hypothetical protein
MSSPLKLSGPLRVGSLTTAQGNGLSAQDGYLYYDTDLAQFRVYEDGQWTELSSSSVLAGTGAGEGASQIGVQDTGGYFTNADVEAVLAEIGLALNGHLDGGSGKHDASEVDFEDTATSAKNLAAGSVEAALTSLDDAIGALAASPVNYNMTALDATIVADHLTAIDTALATAGGSDFSDSTFRISDNTTSTKKIAFEASGISASTTRTITMPDEDINLGNLVKTTGDTMSGALDMGANLINNAGTIRATGPGALELDHTGGANIDLQDSGVTRFRVSTQNVSFANMTFGGTNKIVDLANGAAASQDAATVSQMETADNLRLKLDGTDTMTGSLNMGGNIITSATTYGMGTADVVSASSVDVSIFTGDATTSGNTGNINLNTGTPDSGTKGSVLVNALALDMQSSKIVGLANGTAAGDAVNKGQLDAAVTGLDLKEACRFATDAALPAYTGTGTGTLTLTGQTAWSPDGTAVANTDRVIVKDENGGGAHVDHGIYDVSGVGSEIVLTRSSDADEDAEVTNGMFAFVREGTANNNSGWAVITADTITVNGTAIEFSQFQGLPQYTGGDAITFDGNTIDVDILKQPSKTTPVAADSILIVDSEDTNAIKRTTLTALFDGAGTMTALIDDTAPQLGGALDINSFSIISADTTSAASDDIVLKTGDTSAASDDIVLKTGDTTTSGDSGSLILQSGSAAGSSIRGQVIVNSEGFIRTQDGVGAIEEVYIDAVTLTGGTGAATTISEFTIDTTDYDGAEFTYKMVEATGAVRIGTLRVVSDGTTAVLNDMSTETADLGVVISATQSGTDILVQYTADGIATVNDVIMRTDVKLFRA